MSDAVLLRNIKFTLDTHPHRKLQKIMQGGCIKVEPGFPRLLKSPGFFFCKIPGSGKSWKLKLKVQENPGKISLKIMHFFIDSNRKQAAMVYHPVCVDCCFK